MPSGNGPSLRLFVPFSQAECRGYCTPSSNRGSCDGGPVQGFGIGIHPALLPAQQEKNRQQHSIQQRPQRPPQPFLSSRPVPMYDAGRRSRYRAYAGKILEVVGDKRVAERINVEETQCREKRYCKIKQYCQGRP